MTLDLALLRREAQQVIDDFDNGLWSETEAEIPGFERPKSTPAAVAERCIALIDLVDRINREFGGAYLMIHDGTRFPEPPTVRRTTVREHFGLPEPK